MTSTPATTGLIHLGDREPAVTGAEMVNALVPPPQFDGATFESYRADDAYPSQQESKELLQAFAGTQSAPAKKGGFFRRAEKAPAVKPGVYLDGGFGVGKTHLLASIYHAMPARRKYFGSFIEYTALVGVLGYAKAVELFRGSDLLCIDEFELDDPGDTMVMTRLIKELTETGTRFAATSNTPPGALGEGRFAAQDFLREIQAMSDRFDTMRIDGLDYRRRAVDESAAVVDDVAGLLPTGAVTLDDFGAVVAHLGSVHPSKYVALVEDLDAVGLTDVRAFTDQTDALRWVALVDRLYDAQVRIVASGTPLDQVYPDVMLEGGYRKKYLRAASRVVALTRA